MKKKTFKKLNCFLNKHTSLFNQFQNNEEISHKFNALEKIINLDNHHKIILPVQDNNLHQEEEVVKQTCDKAVRAFNKMYEGIENYENYKLNESCMKQKNSKLYNRISVRSAHLVRRSENKKIKQDSISICQKLQSFKGIQPHRHQKQYEKKLSKNIEGLKIQWKLKQDSKKNKKIKNQIIKLKNRALEVYGIKFNNCFNYDRESRQNQNLANQNNSNQFIKEHFLEFIEEQTDYLNQFREKKKSEKKSSFLINRNTKPQKTQENFVPTNLFRNFHQRNSIQSLYQPHIASKNKKKQGNVKYFRV